MVPNSQKIAQSFEFDEAIAAHKLWLKRLELLISGNAGNNFDANNASSPSACALGKWLDKLAANLSSVDQYHVLWEKHYQFHLVAGDVIRLAKDGQSAKATAQLEGRLTNLSTEIISLIEEIKNQVHGTS